MMPRYRKRPVVIEAVQLSADTLAEVVAWCGGAVREVRFVGGAYALIIPTLEGTLTASPGDWIIRGVAGELYPCKPDIFALTYEPVDE